MDEQIKAATVLAWPGAANLAPECFLVPVRPGLSDNVSDMRWLVRVVLLRWFGLQQRAATLAFAENGGVQAESGFAGTHLERAEGRSPLSHGASTTIYGDIYDEGF